MARTRPVGVDIGSTAVRVAAISGPDDAGYVTVDRYAIVTLPAHAVIAGQIRDPLAVATAVDLAVRQAGVRGRQAVVSVASTRVTVERVSVTSTTPNEDVAAILASTANKIGAATMEDVTVSYDLIGSTTAGGHTIHHIVCSTVPLRDMRAAEDVLRLGDLHPLRAELTANAALRSLLRREPTDPAAAMVVDIGSDLLVAATVEGTHLRNVVAIPGGGADLTRDLAQFLRIDVDIAEARKRFIGLNTAPADHAIPVSEYSDGHEIRKIDHQTPTEEAIATSAEHLIDRIVEIVDADTHSHDMPVTELIVTGGGSRLRGLVPRLSYRTGLACRAGRPWAKLSRRAQPRDGRDPDEVLDDLTVAIGLAQWTPPTT